MVYSPWGGLVGRWAAYAYDNHLNRTFWCTYQLLIRRRPFVISCPNICNYCSHNTNKATGVGCGCRDDCTASDDVVVTGGWQKKIIIIRLGKSKKHIMRLHTPLELFINVMSTKYQPPLAITLLPSVEMVVFGARPMSKRPKYSSRFAQLSHFLEQIHGTQRIERRNQTTEEENGKLKRERDRKRKVYNRTN